MNMNKNTECIHPEIVFSDLRDKKLFVKFTII
jgi:hypothetical protein